MAETPSPELINADNSLSATLPINARLLDITIECSPADASQSNFENLQMKVLDGREVVPDPHPLHRTSAATWKYQGIIELVHDTDQLVIIIQSEKVGKLGVLDLSKETLYNKSTIVAQADVHRQKIVTEEGKPSLWMTFAISLCSEHDRPLAICSKASAGAVFFDAGTASLRRFRETGNILDISNAINDLQLAISHMPEDYESMPRCLNNLGIGFLTRFEQTGNSVDISASIQYHQKSVELTPEGHPNMPSWLNNLGNSFSRCFEQTGDLANISAAIENYQKSVDLTQDGHPSLPLQLNNLGSSFLTRFGRSGDITDISAAIECLQKSVRLTPEGHPNMPPQLSNLGNSFLTRFQRTSDISDISAAIEHQQESVRLTPEGYADKPAQLSNLGNSFLSRFKHTGDISDISAAVEHHQKSVRLTPDGHPDLPAWLNNLGNSFSIRFKQTGDLTDISSAIEHHRKSLGLTPEGHPDMPLRLNSLGNSFSRRFHRTGNLSDISAAIEHHQKSVELTPDGHPDLPSWLNNLGTSFIIRFRQLEDLADIAAAIDHCQNAVKLTPEGHADMLTYRSSLGDFFMTRFMHLEEVGDCWAAAFHYRLAATQNSGRPTTRLHAARRWALCCGKLKDYATCLDAYRTVLELLPLVVSLDQTIHNRHTSLLGISDLTREAATTALLIGSEDVALEWFEQGRCLIWTQLNQLRTPVDLLRQHNAPLAECFLVVSKALETSGSRPETFWKPHSAITDQITVEADARSQLKLAQEWGQLLTKIRALPTFTDFLRPPKTADIFSQLPTDGPVVLINVFQLSCNAVVLIHGADEPLHILIKNFTYEKAELLWKQLGHQLSCEKLRMRNSDDRAGRLSRRPDKGLHHILRELWKCIVWPILQGIGYSSRSPPSRRNRIWWCATGPLAFLPIHAAGIYNPDDKVPGPCLSDFAVSSYIPTVTTLLEKLKNDAILKREETKVLLLSQPNALTHAPIPGTIEETGNVLKRMREADVGVVLLEDVEGTKDRVTEEMRTHSWIHIASHASQHPTEPLKSGFYLQDGRLELLEIMRQRLPSADFAYLSACQTSVGNEKLSEEAIHLAAGMLAAGYQGVVATMWSIKDQYAPKIAEDFYGFLLREMRESGAHRLDSRRAAYALDDATRKIRAKLGDSEHALLTWVPYIHLGL